jgi:hypothetical protein
MTKLRVNRKRLRAMKEASRPEWPKYGFKCGPFWPWPDFLMKDTNSIKASRVSVETMRSIAAFEDE